MAKIRKEIKEGEKSKPKTSSKLTEVEKAWKKYLERINTTPEEFLKRYPNHLFKKVIENLKNN